MMKKIGLVFAGGGGKGAYQIGVWRALEEFGIADKITAVSGTSVGALNAALFIQGDLKTAEEVWLNIGPEKILSVNARSLLKKLSYFISPGPAVIKWLKMIAQAGVFSREGLKEIIEESINIPLVTGSPRSFFAAASRLPGCRTEYFRLNNSGREGFVSILMATSALPGIFAPEEINGKRYLDGGLKANVPVRPLYNEGCSLIFVVHLSRGSLLTGKRPANVQIVEIVPQQALGGFLSGTVDFTPEGAERRLREGYEDTLRVLKPIYHLLKTNYGITKKLADLKRQERGFRQQQEANRLEIKRQREELKQLLQDDN